MSPFFKQECINCIAFQPTTRVLSLCLCGNDETKCSSHSLHRSSSATESKHETLFLYELLPYSLKRKAKVKPVAFLVKSGQAVLRIKLQKISTPMHMDKIHSIFNINVSSYFSSFNIQLNLDNMTKACIYLNLHTFIAQMIVSYCSRRQIFKRKNTPKM